VCGGSDNARCEPATGSALAFYQSRSSMEKQSATVGVGVEGQVLSIRVERMC
jgi:hypothetical protein